jgi:hypothetical protein
MNRECRSIIAALSLAALTMGIEGRLFAQESATPEADVQLTAAKVEFEEAQRLFIKEQFDGAAAKFLAAFEKKPYGAFLFNAAVAYERSQKWELSIDYFQRYIDKNPEARDKRDVELRLLGLQRVLNASRAAAAPQPGQAPAAPAEVAMLPALETKGLVIIDSKPQGATIYLDDKKNGPLGTTSWQGSLEPRPVKIILEAKGFKPETRLVTPRSDKILDIFIALSEEHFLGWVEIASNVAGADVFLDRKEIGAIGRTPYTGHIKPGKHTVWVEKAGYGTMQKEIDVQPGTATTHNIDLSKVSVGWIAVIGKKSRGAKLFVDDKFACDTPCQQETSPGIHEVRVEREGMEDYEGSLSVKQATQSLVEIQFVPKPPRARAWTTGVISAAFLGAGIYAGLHSKKLEDGIKDDIKAGQLIDNNDPRVSQGKLWSIGANAAFGVSAITGIMSLYNFLRSNPASTGELDEKNVAITPVGLPGGAGIFASGRF